MPKIAIKSDKITPFGGICSIMQQFDRSLSQVIDSYSRGEVLIPEHTRLHKVYVVYRGVEMVACEEIV